MAKRIFIFVTILVLCLDQLSKLLVLKYLVGKNISLGFFSLIYATNTGGAFGLFSRYSFYFVLAGIFVLLGFLFFYRRIQALSALEQVLLGGIAGGALGNLTDRFRLGFVVDFIDFKFWPVFNLADSCITLGVLGLIILELKKSKGEKK